jgi:hypothetical protein
MGKMNSSVRPPPPPPAMTIEAASGDTELEAYFEVLAEIDALDGVIASKLSAFASLVVDARADARTMHPLVCLRAGYLLRDRLRSVLQTPATVPELVPSPDMVLLKATRAVYPWAIEGLERACEPMGPVEHPGPEAVLDGLAEVASLFTGAGDVSGAVEAVMEAVRAFATSIRHLQRTDAATQR